MEDKTMKKVFGIAALLLALAACNKVETEITPVEQPSDSKGITITATLAPKTAVTKAVTDNGDNKITVTWAENEHIAILYDKDGAQVADATITAVDGTTGAATISFTVVSGTADNTACTLVYPYSAAKDDKSGVKDAATLLAAQNGTLNADLDVRVGAGTIQTTTPGLDVTTQPEAQFAIFKFTVKNADASATIDVKPLTVTIDTQHYVITPASATSTLYVALPAVSSKTVSFSATGSDSKTYICSKDGVTFAAAKYYQSTLKMTAAVTYIGTKSPTEAKAVGDIVFSDGSATAYTSGLTLTDEQKAAAVAVIFYAGSASDILGAKTLGVGLKNTNDETTKTLAFARNTSGTAEGYNTNITAIQCTPSESGDGKAATATFTGDLDGSDNWTALCAAVNDEGTSGNYPAWEWVNAYATTANLTGEYASGWYLPTVAELCMLYRAKDTVNAALEKAGGTKIADAYHWSSSQSSNNSKAWMVKFDSGKLMDTYKGNKWYVCGVRAFN